jgi:hypothetical protein
MILKPQDTTTLSGAVVSGLYDSFEEKVHTNLSTVFLGADHDGGVGCFIIGLPGNAFAYAMIDKGSSVTKLDGTKVSSTLNADGVDDSLGVNKDGDEFFRVAISPEFREEVELRSCEPLGDFYLGSPVERRVISYSKLKSMERRYYDGGYEGLRSELKVPPIFDFAINVNGLNVKMEPSLGIPNSVEVMAEDRVVEVLRQNGTVSNERFTLKIW